MKNLYRFLAFVLPILLLMSSCARFSTSLDDASLEPSLSGGAPVSAGAQIALITLETEHNTPFIQSVWNTISRFSGENGYACTSLTVAQPTVKAAQATLELAVKGGAKLVVTSGPLMSEMLFSLSQQYTDTEFILFSRDSYQARDNVYSIVYQAEQGGWLAGYAAVAAGQRSFVYLSADSNEAQRCSLGFLLGADAAAIDLDLGPGAITATGFTLLPEESLSSLADRLATFLQNNPATLLINDSSVLAPALAAAQTAGCDIIGISLEPTLLTDGTALLSIQYDPDAMLVNALSTWVYRGSFSPAGSINHGLVEFQDIYLALGKDILPFFSERQSNQLTEYFLDSKISETLSWAIPDTHRLPEPFELELSTAVILR